MHVEHWEEWQEEGMSEEWRMKKSWALRLKMKKRGGDREDRE